MNFLQSINHWLIALPVGFVAFVVQIIIFSITDSKYDSKLKDKTSK